MKRAPPSNKRRPLKSAAPKTSKILRAPRRLIEEIRYYCEILMFLIIFYLIYHYFFIFIVSQLFRMMLFTTVCEWEININVLDDSKTVCRECKTFKANICCSTLFLLLLSIFVQICLDCFFPKMPRFHCNLLELQFFNTKLKLNPFKSSYKSIKGCGELSGEISPFASEIFSHFYFD